MHSLNRNRCREVNGLKLYQPSVQESQIARWKINGYFASIIIWTAEEWNQLEERPEDAQYYPCGIWCALRLED